MYKILVMFCCLYLIVVDTSNDGMDRPIQLCGEKLAEAVRIICRGKYHFEYSREKRNCKYFCLRFYYAQISNFEYFYII